jgi:hypothetical protein
VPGRTAQFWGRVWHGVGVAWVPLMIVMLLFAVNIEAAGTPAYFLVSGSVWMVCVLLFGTTGGGPLTWLEGRRERAERAAGYTTTVGIAIADEVMVELDVVDPRSARVIRLAGERMPKAFFNDRQAFMRERIRQVRAVAEGMTDAAQQ